MDEYINREGINVVDDQNNTMLIDARSHMYDPNFSVSIINHLLSKGIDINHTNDQRKSAFSPSFFVFSPNDLYFMQKLLERSDFDIHIISEADKFCIFIHVRNITDGMEITWINFLRLLIQRGVVDKNKIMSYLTSPRLAVFRKKLNSIL